MAVGDTSGSAAPRGDETAVDLHELTMELAAAYARVGVAGVKLNTLSEVVDRMGGQLEEAKGGVRVAKIEHNNTLKNLLGGLNGALLKGAVSFEQAIGMLQLDPGQTARLSELYSLSKDTIQLNEDYVLEADGGGVVWGTVVSLSPQIAVTDRVGGGMSVHMAVKLQQPIDDVSDEQDIPPVDVMVRAEQLNDDIISVECLEAKIIGVSLFSRLDGGLHFDEAEFVRLGGHLDALNWLNGDIDSIKSSLDYWSRMIGERIDLQYKGGQWSLKGFELPTAHVELGGMQRLVEVVDTMRRYFPEGYKALKQKTAMTMALVKYGWPNELGSRDTAAHWNETAALTFAQADTGFIRPSERYMAADEFMRYGAREVAKVEAGEV